MNVLKCDMPECDGKFYSASLISLIRRQAVSAGWKRPRMSKTRGPDGEPLAEPKTTRKMDLCPLHQTGKVR